MYTVPVDVHVVSEGKYSSIFLNYRLDKKKSNCSQM